MKWIKYFDAPILFVFLAIIFGVIFIKVVPPFWGVDEIVHFDRAYQLSTGNLVEDRLSDNFYGGLLPSDTVSAQKYVFQDLLDNKTAHEVDNNKIYDTYKRNHPSKRLQKYSFTSSGGYSPLAYAPPAVGIFIARAFGATNGGIIFMARFATLLFYVGLVFGALWLLRASRQRWLVFVVGLLPMSLFQASIVNVDSVVTGLSILLFALLFRFWKRDKPVSYLQLGLLFSVGLWLSLTKPNYFLLSALMLFLPARVLPAGRKILWRVGLVLIPLILMLAWNHIAQPMIHSALVVQKGADVSSTINTSRQVINVIHHPVGFAGTIVRSATENKWFDSTMGNLGYNFVLIPGYIIFLLTSLLILATFYRVTPSKDSTSTNLPYLMLAAALLTFFSIIGVFYSQYTAVGARMIEGIQGRYFVSLLPFIAVAIGRLVPIKVQMSPRTASILFSGVASFSLVASIVYYHFITY